MPDQQYSVEQWDKDAMQAAQISVGWCLHADTIGIDMHAQDGNVFAHGNFDVPTAFAFVTLMNTAIEEAVAASRAKN